MVQVEGRDRRQSEMNVQCEQIISTHTSSTVSTVFVTAARYVRSRNVCIAT